MGTFLSVVVACGSKAVDHPAIGDGKGGVWDKGRDDVDGTGGEQEFFPADHHLQFAFYDMGDLFMDMGVFEQHTAFLYVPENEGAAFPMDHFPEKAWQELFDWDVLEVLHALSLPEGTSK